jgi:hypothetical protein
MDRKALRNLERQLLCDLGRRLEDACRKVCVDAESPICLDKCAVGEVSLLSDVKVSDSFGLFNKDSTLSCFERGATLLYLLNFHQGNQEVVLAALAVLCIPLSATFTMSHWNGARRPETLNEVFAAADGTPAPFDELSIQEKSEFVSSLTMGINRLVIANMLTCACMKLKCAQKVKSNKISILLRMSMRIFVVARDIPIGGGVVVESIACLADFLAIFVGDRVAMATAVPSIGILGSSMDEVQLRTMAIHGKGIGNALSRIGNKKTLCLDVNKIFESVILHGLCNAIRASASAGAVVTCVPEANIQMSADGKEFVFDSDGTISVSIGDGTERTLVLLVDGCVHFTSLAKCVRAVGALSSDAFIAEEVPGYESRNRFRMLPTELTKRWVLRDILPAEIFTIVVIPVMCRASFEFKRLISSVISYAGEELKHVKPRNKFAKFSKRFQFVAAYDIAAKTFTLAVKSFGENIDSGCLFGCRNPVCVSACAVDSGVVNFVNWIQAALDAFLSRLVAVEEGAAV